jgi:NADH-quinone oxidoreductase subunit M
MMLVFLLAWPLLLSIVALFSSVWSRLITLFALVSNFFILIFAWLSGDILFQVPWLPQWGASIHLELDGLSLVMLIVTHITALMGLWSCWDVINDKIALFYANFLWLLSGVIGVLLSFDLLLFFIFWELMIVPIYLASTLWGTGKSIFASLQFLIFTQASGLIMLAAILGLYFTQHTFDFTKILNSHMHSPYELFILFGFLTAFLVKLPALGFHVWLPALFESSPTAIVLVGIMVKTGAYGILRFVLPLFPESCAVISTYIMLWGALGLIYGAVLAFAETDIRKILAYATLSHMGAVLMALFSSSAFAYQGVVILLVTEALSVGALLLLFSRFNNNNLGQLGGIWAQAPKVGAMALFFILASVGLPFLGNFVGEYMSLVGIFSASKAFGFTMALGLILSAVYYTRLMQKIFFGKSSALIITKELSSYQTMLFGLICLLLLFIGLYPVSLLSVITKTTLFLE